MTINIENVRATLDSIRHHGPEHFNMSYWVHTPVCKLWNELNHIVDINLNDCGTTACLAGHATSVAHQQGVDIKGWGSWEAAAWLGLEAPDRDDAHRSCECFDTNETSWFHRSEWPDEWNEFYESVIDQDRPIEETLLQGCGMKLREARFAEWLTVINGLELMIKEAEAEAEAE